MKNENPIFYKNDDLYSSSSEYMSSSASTISNKKEKENKSKEIPNFEFSFNISENDYMSDEQFNQMQEEILRSGQKLEPLIQAYVQNHKKSSSFLPIHNLFDLFKRELKMNLIIRQNLIKERSIKQEILNKYNQQEKEKNDFFQRISHELRKNLNNYEEIIPLLSQLVTTISNNSNTEKSSIVKEMKVLKEENERLIQQNNIIQNSLNDKEVEKSFEISQLLSAIQNSKSKIQNFELQFKNHNFQINQLQVKIEKKKQKISSLKNTISELSTSNETKIKQYNENLLKYEKLINDLNSEKEQLKKENEKQKENQEKSKNENDELSFKAQKIEDENASFKQIIKELSEKLKENQKLIQKYKEDDMLNKNVKKNNNKLRKKNKYFHRLLKDMSTQLNQKIEDVEKANQTIQRLNSKIGKLQNIHSIEIDLIKTQHLEQSQKTNEKLLVLEEKFHVIQKNYTFCNDENKRLHYQLKQASIDINRLESENAKLLAKLEQISLLNENQNEINDEQENT